jgi:O-antigen ligase
MNREVLDGWCQRGILALVLAILVFGPLATGAVRTLQFLILQDLTLGVMLLWGARLWLSDRPRLLWPPICWAVLAFTLYAVARYLTADIEYVARQELIRILVYAALFFAILNNLHRQESTQTISFTLIFLAMGISFYALYQFLTGDNRVWYFPGLYEHRGSGTYISPNHLGGFLEMLLPLGLTYTLAGRLKPLARVFLGYASLAIIAGIAVTVSRGAWISTGLALALLFGVLVFHRSHRLPSLVLLGVVLAAGFLVVPKSYFLQVRWNLLSAGDVNALHKDTRYTLWRPAWQIWQDHPWWGAGPAHYDYRFRAYRPDSVQLRPDRAHNDYLNTLADWGLVGAALVASACVMLGVGIGKTWRSVWGNSNELGAKPGSNKLAFLLGATFGLLAIMFHSVVDFNMHIPANAILAVTLMALLSAHLRFTTDRYWTGLRLWTKALATAFLMAGIAYLAEQSWCHTSEYVWLERAARAPRYSPEQAGLLSKAFAAEPKNADTADAIGEAFRVQSLAGGGDYRELATTALVWFERAMKLNPLDASGFLRYGSCLDWPLGRQAESAPYFSRAEELDPNSYFTVATVGLHYVQLEDYAAAKPWFERSLRLQWADNPIAHSYLEIANLRLLEAATNTLGAQLQPAAP